MERTCDHFSSAGGCECSSKASSYAQSLPEMDFERGLWQAALDGNAKRVKSLLDTGRDPDERDASGYTALHYASRSGHNDVCDLLLDRGADANAQTRSGKVTSLHRAAYCGHITVVKCLVKHGADVRLSDNDGQTPLHKAAEKLQKDVIRILLDIDSDLVRIKDNSGKTPADLVPLNQPDLLDMVKPK